MTTGIVYGGVLGSTAAVVVLMAEVPMDVWEMVELSHLVKPPKLQQSTKIYVSFVYN